MNRETAFKNILEGIRDIVYTGNVNTDFIWWAGSDYSLSSGYTTLYRYGDLALYLSGRTLVVTGTQDRELHCMREFLEILRDYISRQ